MEKEFIALTTKSFTEEQALADIIEGKKYIGDKDNEYFISEYGDTIYLAKEDFEIYFKSFERKSHRKAIQKYFKNNVKVVYLRLFPEDKDIIQHLETIKVEEKGRARNGQSEYIRKLIREDMQKQKGK